MSIYGKWLQLCKGRFLRIADLGADRSERRQTAHFYHRHPPDTVATNYGSSYALEVTTAQPERVWT
jgi:hypothetical protein